MLWNLQQGRAWLTSVQLGCRPKARQPGESDGRKSRFPRDFLRREATLGLHGVRCPVPARPVQGPAPGGAVRRRRLHSGGTEGKNRGSATSGLKPLTPVYLAGRHSQREVPTLHADSGQQQRHPCGDDNAPDGSGSAIS